MTPQSAHRINAVLLGAIDLIESNILYQNQMRFLILFFIVSVHFSSAYAYAFPQLRRSTLNRRSSVAIHGQKVSRFRLHTLYSTEMDSSSGTKSVQDSIQATRSNIEEFTDGCSTASGIVTKGPDVNESNFESVENAIKLGKTLAVFNPSEFNISASNPFSDPVTSIEMAREELLQLVKYRQSELRSSDFLRCRIEYLVKVLKSSYISSFTVQFLNLVMTGHWRHCYSNVLLRRADESLSCSISQQIHPGPDLSETQTKKEGEGGKSPLDESVGKIINSIDWQVVDRDNNLNHGKLNVIANYELNSKGSLQLELEEHVVNAVKLSLEPLDLIMAIQRSIPFQFFDPTDSTTQNVYVDPELRISETSGPIFAGIYDIFVKEEEGEEGRGKAFGNNSRTAAV